MRALGVIPNRPASIRKLVKTLGPADDLRVCYEAGPTGYVIYWQLTGLAVRCEVVAPTLVPVKAGDRVKTDRRDAQKLARSYRAGDLTPVWVPDAAHEALRDLVRAREAGKKDQLRARHRLGKFLLRHGRRPPLGTRAWTHRSLLWVKRDVHFEHAAQEATLLDYLHEVEHVADRIARLEDAIDYAVTMAPPAMRAVIEALQALRGIALVSAVTVAAEVGELSRFARAPQLMGYSGMGAREDSSGARTRRVGSRKPATRTSGVGSPGSQAVDGCATCHGEALRSHGARPVNPGRIAHDVAERATADNRRCRRLRAGSGERGVSDPVFGEIARSAKRLR